MNKSSLCRLLTVVVLACMSTPGVRALSPTEAFVNAPDRIFPLLDRNTRLDMVDYFKSGLSTRSTNAFNGGSAITALTPQSVSVQITGSTGAQLALLPAGNDTIMALITTVLTPIADSRLDLYSSDWNKELTGKLFRAPSEADWLTPEGRRNTAQVKSLVPFMLVDYLYDPDSSTLTLTNRTPEFLSKEDAETVKPFFINSISYR